MRNLSSNQAWIPASAGMTKCNTAKSSCHSALDAESIAKPSTDSELLHILQWIPASAGMTKRRVRNLNPSVIPCLMRSLKNKSRFGK